MTRTFERFAAYTALAAAAAGLVFTIAFAIVVQEGERWAAWTSWASLTAGGLVAVPVMIGLYALLRQAEPELALLGLVLGVAGTLGAAVHGAFELSLLANEPALSPRFPNAVDPRGFMTFAVTGLALLVFGWLVIRTGRLPRDIGWLAVAGAILLVVVYVARLTVLDPKTNVIRVAALTSGLVVLPAFYARVARTLLRRQGHIPAPPDVSPGDRARTAAQEVP